jgi:hypothetical protein
MTWSPTQELSEFTGHHPIVIRPLGIHIEDVSDFVRVRDVPQAARLRGFVQASRLHYGETR